MTGDTILHQQCLLFAGAAELITMSFSAVTSAVPVVIAQVLTIVTWVPPQFTIASTSLYSEDTDVHVPDVGDSFTHCSSDMALVVQAITNKKITPKYLLEITFPLVLSVNISNCVFVHNTKNYVLTRFFINALRNVTSYVPVLAARFAHHSLQDL